MCCEVGDHYKNIKRLYPTERAVTTAMEGLGGVETGKERWGGGRGRKRTDRSFTFIVFL